MANNNEVSLADAIVTQATAGPTANQSRRRTKGLMERENSSIAAEFDRDTEDMQAYINDLVNTIREERTPLARDYSLAPSESLRPVSREEEDDTVTRPKMRPGDETAPRPKKRPKDLGTFKQRMMASESGGKTDVQITIKDGRKMTGGFQFGDARLKDYMKATGTEFTTEQFRNDEGLQERVFDWHIADIDEEIDSLDAEGYNRDGLRAVAHLGGITGMKKYVKTKGKYNPDDDFGTTLQDYYDKFSL